MRGKDISGCSVEQSSQCSPAASKQGIRVLGITLQVQVLEAAFSQFGAVQRAIVVADPANNTSRRSIPAADTQPWNPSLTLTNMPLWMPPVLLGRSQQAPLHRGAARHALARCGAEYTV